MRQSVLRGRVFALPFLVGALFLGVVAVAGALTPPDPNQVIDHVDICHRTNSNNTPYIVNSPAADGDVSGHADHVGDGTQTEPKPGPVWNPTLKADHIRWGDIIPPFKWSGGDFPGMNWTATGQAIYENDCDPDLPPPELFGTLKIVKAVQNPDSVILPSGGYTVHVVCDDLINRGPYAIPSGGTGANPIVIDDIEAGSHCIVTEDPVSGSVVAYDPLAASTAPGVLVDEFVDSSDIVTVTITNTFSNPPAPAVSPAVEAAAAEAVQVTPTFTG